MLRKCYVSAAYLGCIDSIRDVLQYLAASGAASLLDAPPLRLFALSILGRPTQQLADSRTYFALTIMKMRMVSSFPKRFALNQRASVDLFS